MFMRGEWMSESVFWPYRTGADAAYLRGDRLFYVPIETMIADEEDRIRLQKICLALIDNNIEPNDVRVLGIFRVFRDFCR